MIPQTNSIEVEPLFDGFIRSFGGSVVREIISNVNPLKNADYFFRSPSVIAELKCIERDAFTREEEEKIERLFASWRIRRLLIVFGTRKISFRELPKVYQEELLAVLQSSRKRRLEKANNQIKETKILLGVPDARGVLFLVNDAPTYLPPLDEMNLVARILQSKKPDGSNIYSHLHWIVYFSVNPKAVTADGVGLNFWLPCFREQGDSVTEQFLQELRLAWIRYHGQQLGMNSFEIPAES